MKESTKEILQLLESDRDNLRERQKLSDHEAEKFQLDQLAVHLDRLIVCARSIINAESLLADGNRNGVRHAVRGIWSGTEL